MSWHRHPASRTLSLLLSPVPGLALPYRISYPRPSPPPFLCPSRARNRSPSLIVRLLSYREIAESGVKFPFLLSCRSRGAKTGVLIEKVKVIKKVERSGGGDKREEDGRGEEGRNDARRVRKRSIFLCAILPWIYTRAASPFSLFLPLYLVAFLAPFRTLASSLSLSLFSTFPRHTRAGVQWLFTKRSWLRSSRFNRPPSRRDTKKRRRGEKEPERYHSCKHEWHAIETDVSTDSLSWTKVTWNLRDNSPYKTTSRSSFLGVLSWYIGRILESLNKRNGAETRRFSRRRLELLRPVSFAPPHRAFSARVHLHLDLRTAWNSPRGRRLFALRDARVFDVRSRYRSRVVAS